jgi:hypothetical protein
MQAEYNMWKQMLTMLLQFANWAEIHYLPVYHPSEVRFLGIVPYRNLL